MTQSHSASTSSIGPPLQPHKQKSRAAMRPSSAGSLQRRSLDNLRARRVAATNIPPESAQETPGVLPFSSRPPSPHLRLEATKRSCRAERRVSPPSTLQQRGEGEVPTTSQTDSSRPVLGVLGDKDTTNKHAHQARRFNQNGPLATPGQRVRANIELWSEHTIDLSPSDTMNVDSRMEDLENMSPSHDLMSSFSGGPLELMSMADFDKANPYTPPPRRTAPALRSDSKHGEFTARLHWACDARGIARDFTYHTVALDCYDVELYLNGKLVDRIGQYASHKDAREEMCKKHLATVELMPNQKKRKESNAAYHPVPAGIDDEPWVNLVFQYTAQNQLPPPDFYFPDDHGNLPPWGCTLRIKGSPLTPFGGLDKQYAVKMNAKKAAAMEAVQWLRSQTKMAPAPGNRRKSSGITKVEAVMAASPASLPDEQGHTGLSQTLRSSDVNTSNGRPSEQVHQLVLELGLTQPCYRHAAANMGEAFYDTFAEFTERDVRREPRVGGKLGLVSHIYGKNAAKQACATIVLEVLAEIRRSRIGY